MGLIGCDASTEVLIDPTATTVSPTIDKSLGISSKNEAEVTETAQIAEDGAQVEKGRRYSTKEEVAAYINMFHQLPPNYITKREAEKEGWDSSKGNLWEVTDKMSIGGDVFGNREGDLPKKQGRKYYECDINYKGGYRGSERIVYSNDGLVFCTVDHYKTFEQLYGEGD